MIEIALIFAGLIGLLLVIVAIVLTILAGELKDD
jgi:hypothetical protein